MCIKLLLLAVMTSGVHVRVSGQLSINYYVTSCPQVENIVSAWLTANVFTDPTGPAALIRMLFHDCQVGVSPHTTPLSPPSGELWKDFSVVSPVSLF